MNCVHCQAEPEVRKDTATGRTLLTCTECKTFGVASHSAAYARATWAIINDDELPLHHCRNGVRPRFFMREGRWGCRCTACGFDSGVVATIEGAVAMWMSESRNT